LVKYELGLLLRPGLQRNVLWMEQRAFYLPFLWQGFFFYFLTAMAIIFCLLFIKGIHTKIITEWYNILTWSTKAFGVFVYSVTGGFDLIRKLSTLHRKGVMYADYKYVLPQYKFTEIKLYDEFWYVPIVVAASVDIAIFSIILYIVNILIIYFLVYCIMYNSVNFRKIDMYLLVKNGLFNKKKRTIL
jgi:hypothetical protein